MTPDQRNDSATRFFNENLYATLLRSSAFPINVITQQMIAAQASNIYSHSIFPWNIASLREAATKELNLAILRQQNSKILSHASGQSSPTFTALKPIKRFTCQTCHRSFGYKHVLINHERTHTGEKPFVCGTCDKRFTRDHHLKTHMRLHTGEKPYQCKYCDRRFVQVANLRRHARIHTGDKPYICSKCDSRFADSDQLKRHSINHHDEISDDSQNESQLDMQIESPNESQNESQIDSQIDSINETIILPLDLSLKATIQIIEQPRKSHDIRHILC